MYCESIFLYIVITTLRLSLTIEICITYTLKDISYTEDIIIANKKYFKHTLSQKYILKAKEM